MNVRYLIDSIVQQTTVLIAQLATSGGVRAPLAHIANQVFLELAKELDAQGVSRKVSADMFGMALRAYQRKLQRLSESTTDRGRSLWEAILEYITVKEMVSRGEVLRRFHQDDVATVRSILNDMVVNGLVFASRVGPSTVFRIVTVEEMNRIQRISSDEGLPEFLWVLIYRYGPMTRDDIAKQIILEPSVLDKALDRLVLEGRLNRRCRFDETVYSSSDFYLPLDAQVGWEAAIFDHFQAMVQTICSKLQKDSDGTSADDTVGGSTYTLDIWKGHPLEQEARGSLKRFRQQLSDLRQRIKRYNSECGYPETIDRIVIYGGQCEIPGQQKAEQETSDES